MNVEILNKCGLTPYDIFGFFGSLLLNKRGLPLMTFLLYLGPTTPVPLDLPQCQEQFCDPPKTLTLKPKN